MWQNEEWGEDESREGEHSSYAITDEGAEETDGGKTSLRPPFPPGIEKQILSR